MILFALSDVCFKDLIQYPDISINEHEVTFICGKSGSGKSTLLKLFNATTPFDAGELLYQGKSINEYDTILLRREVMLVSQNVFLFDDTIRNNFREYYHYRELPMPDDNLLNKYLHVCAADFPLNSQCASMSGGERQRTFIAICLSLMPKVLMLDEPTSALDDQTSREFMKNITEYCRQNNITLLAITHDRSLADTYADKVISLCQEVQYE